LIGGNVKWKVNEMDCCSILMLACIGLFFMTCVGFAFLFYLIIGS